MFETLDQRWPRMEPRRWHPWAAAIMALLLLAALGRYAFDHRSTGALIFACINGAVVIAAWLSSLCGLIRAYLAYLIALICLSALYWIGLQLR